MSTPSPVNSQITDSVTQTNVKTLGETPAQAMGELYQNEAEQEGKTAEEENTKADE